MSAMRQGDEPARNWCDVGRYRACLERSAGELRFTIHGKPDVSQGFAQAVVLARGWILAEEEVVYSPGSRVLTPDLESALLMASRKNG